MMMKASIFHPFMGMKQCHLQLAIFFSDRFGEDYLKWEAIDT
jgi:hypothetical protein